MKLNNPFETIGWKTYLFIFIIVTLMAGSRGIFFESDMFIVGFYIGSSAALFVIIAVFHMLFVKQDNKKIEKGVVV